MWIIMPLIYFMSWKSCRRFGQAFSETASWAVGYFMGTGILLMLHYGGVGLISATPDDPAAVVPVITGFIGMAFSRYLWKRRGGHLEPVNNPLTNSRWFRAGQAILFSGKKKKSAPRSQATLKRSATVASTPNRVAPTRPATAPSATSTSTQTSTRPAPNTVNSPARPVATRPAATRPPATPAKSNAARWGRVIGAMIQTDNSQRRPPPR